jgi:hypothetical protein
MKKNVLSIPATISEMASSSDEFEVDVPFAAGVDIDKLTEDDPKPLFVTVEVANESISKNKRRYTKELLQDICRQINEKKPNAYSGHLKEEDRATANPEVQTIWLGAKVVSRKGKFAIIAKGYVLPTASSLRTYLKKALAAGKKATVSIYGTAVQKWNSVVKAYDISHFNLESIDWARHLSEGVAGAGLLSVASEMANMEDREDVLKSTTLSEMESVNPTLVSEFKDLGRKDVEAELAEMVLDSELRNKVTNTKARTVLKPLVISEMKEQTKAEAMRAVEVVLESEAGKTVVTEMTSSTRIAPVVDNRTTGKSTKFIKGVN